MAVGHPQKSLPSTLNRCPYCKYRCITCKMGSGNPILSNVFHIFAWPCTCSSLNIRRAICVGYCHAHMPHLALTHRPDNVMMGTYREFRILPILVRCNPYGHLQRAGQIAFLRIYL